MNVRRDVRSAMRAAQSGLFHLVLMVALLGPCAGGRPISETLQRALSAGRGPSPGAKKLLNIPDDGGYVPNPALITIPCTYNDYQNTKTHRPLNLTSLRKKLVNLYLNERKLPTLKDIDALRNPVLNPSQDKFFYSLAHHGFVWKIIPGTGKAIFVEKYEKIATRLKYLIGMKEHRRAGRHIVYLEDITYIPQLTQKSFIAISNKQGVLSLTMKTEEANEFKSYDYQKSGLRTKVAAKEGKQKQFLTNRPMTHYGTVQNVPRVYNSLLDGNSETEHHIDWLNNYVLKVVSEPSVFVFEDCPIPQDDILGPYSPKEDIKNYLDAIGVPYDHRAHRFELYELVKRFSKPILDKFIELIVAQGHEVLLVPHGFESLNFFQWFWEPNFTNKDYGIVKIKKAEMDLADAEEKQFDEDRIMEEVVDKVMTLGKYEGVADDGLTDYSDVMKYDSECNVENIFVD